MTPPDTTLASAAGSHKHYRLRRELIWAIALKLMLLFSLKAAFFPQRLPADAAAQGLVERLASSGSPAQQTISKENP